ncbi:MAG: hypothetical protein PGN22_15790 [Agrobacterium cavarae]
MIDLTEQERQVLTAWEDCDADFDVLNFNDIAHGSQMVREDAAAATRSLAAKGLAIFRRGTFTEEGSPYGSGYGLTDAGRTAMSERTANA